MFGLNWGNGFITDQNIITSRGLSDPNEFFQDLLSKDYADKVGVAGCALERLWSVFAVAAAGLGGCRAQLTMRHT
jgi:hypothetical protein